MGDSPGFFSRAGCARNRGYRPAAQYINRALKALRFISPRRYGISGQVRLLIAGRFAQVLFQELERSLGVDHVGAVEEFDFALTFHL